jgi:hypothetical protein
VGAVIFAASAVVFAMGFSLWNYYTGMTLLGVAWNFSYSGATVMLTGCYTVSYELFVWIIIEVEACLPLL